MIQVPSDFPGGGPVWLFSIVSSGAIVAATTVKILLWLKPNGHANGNGKAAHLDSRDLNRITDKMDEGFKDLAAQLSRQHDQLRGDNKSLQSYMIAAQLGVDKLLERETKE